MTIKKLSKKSNSIANKSSSKKTSKKSNTGKVRPSPSEHAGDFKNKTKTGNDGQKYVSKPNKNGVYSWKKASIKCKTYATSSPPRVYVLVNYSGKLTSTIAKTLTDCAKKHSGAKGKSGTLKEKGNIILTDVEFKFPSKEKASTFTKDVKKKKLEIITKIMGKYYEKYGDRTPARPNCEWQQADK
jgi:hypothetical protein